MTEHDDLDPAPQQPRPTAAVRWSSADLGAELADLRAAGYRADFEATMSGLRCSACGAVQEPRTALVEDTVRFEGASNPSDESILIGLRCASCSARGVLVSAYGPTASAEEAAVLPQLGDAWRDDR